MHFRDTRLPGLPGDGREQGGDAVELMCGIVQGNAVGDEPPAQTILRLMHDLLTSSGVAVIKGSIARERADGPLETIPQVSQIGEKVGEIRLVFDRDDAVDSRDAFDNGGVASEGQQPRFSIGAQEAHGRSQRSGQKRVAEVAKRDDQDPRFVSGKAGEDGGCDRKHQDRLRRQVLSVRSERVYEVGREESVTP